MSRAIFFRIFLSLAHYSYNHNIGNNHRVELISVQCDVEVNNHRVELILVPYDVEFPLVFDSVFTCDEKYFG